MGKKKSKRGADLAPNSTNPASSGALPESKPSVSSENNRELAVASSVTALPTTSSKVAPPATSDALPKSEPSVSAKKPRELTAASPTTAPPTSSPEVASPSLATTTEESTQESSASSPKAGEKPAVMATASSTHRVFPPMPSTLEGWRHFYNTQHELWKVREAMAEAEVDQLAIMVELSALTAGIPLNTSKAGFREKMSLIMTQQVLAGIIKSKLEAQNEQIRQRKADLEETARSVDRIESNFNNEVTRLKGENDRGFKQYADLEASKNALEEELAQLKKASQERSLAQSQELTVSKVKTVLEEVAGPAKITAEAATQTFSPPCPSVVTLPQTSNAFAVEVRDDSTNLAAEKPEKPEKAKKPSKKQKKRDAIAKAAAAEQNFSSSAPSAPSATIDTILLSPAEPEGEAAEAGKATPHQTRGNRSPRLVLMSVLTSPALWLALVLVMAWLRQPAPVSVGSLDQSPDLAVSAKFGDLVTHITGLVGEAHNPWGADGTDGMEADDNLDAQDMELETLLSPSLPGTPDPRPDWVKYWENVSGLEWCAEDANRTTIEYDLGCPARNLLIEVAREATTPSATSVLSSSLGLVVSFAHTSLDYTTHLVLRLLAVVTCGGADSGLHR